MLAMSGSIEAQELHFEKLSTYHTGVFDNSAAEITAFDAGSQKLFVVNGGSSTIDILDASDLSNPTYLSSISFDAGEAANSVAVYNGMVAVAVQNANKQLNGFIKVYNHNGVHIATYNAGALPDMVTFSKDGNKIITANEGEPNDDYTIDPEGSITVVDVATGFASAQVHQITFEMFNDKVASLRNKGVRIYGPNATVAQDLEPEYVTISDDGTTAHVSLQENNALAVIDLVNYQVLDILPLGLKDYNSGKATLQTFNLNENEDWPVLGTPTYGGGQQEILLGGLSGMFFDADNSDAYNYHFCAIPDRGPNDSPVAKADVGTTQNLRPFKLPNYASRIVRFVYHPFTKSISFDQNDQIILTYPDGVTPISGKGNIPGFDEVPVIYTDINTLYANTNYTSATTGTDYHELSFDKFGGDFEGIVIDKNGHYWMCDEYRPAVYHFDENGVMVDRFVAEGTHLLADPAYAEAVYGDNATSGCLNAGFYGTESLPEVYAKRRANRGFEALAYDGDNHMFYAFIQSPLYNPSSVTKNNSDVIRILAIDANGTPQGEYVYLLERNKDTGYGAKRTDKIGDAVYIKNGRFLIIERDSSIPGDEGGKKVIYEIDINGATNILGTVISQDMTINPLETLSADQIEAEGIQVVHKRAILNANSIGYFPSDKLEGITVLPDNKIAVLNDNDFGIAGAGVTDNSQFGVISFGNNNGIDPSDKDDGVNIQNWPAYGMFMPDAIKSYNVNGMEYIVTANEGDSRDYDGYSEEDRGDDLTLSPTYFEFIDELQEKKHLGRLKISKATGDFTNDGIYEEIHSYGARSFSIFDQYGNLVYDSGNDFAQYLSVHFPNDFNLTNDENQSNENRSDDKGTEPEAVEIAMLFGRTYVFIGLERQSGIMVYDITNPKNPMFKNYLTNRDLSIDIENATTEQMIQLGDLGPEDIKWIKAEDSPNNKNVLVVANEVSGTVTFYSVEDSETLDITQNTMDSEKLLAYPNPTNGIVKMSKEDRYSVVNAMGTQVVIVENGSEIDLSKLSPGVYFIKSSNHEVIKIIKQ